MPVRMKDIARELGISVVTVSKVLRDHPDIGSDTRERVLKRMKELNYRPNLAARALVTGHSSSIGLVVPDLVHTFFAQVARGLSKTLRKKGYSLLIASSEEDPELEQQEIEQLLARRVDALIVASSQWTIETFRHIEEQKVPYILIDRKFADLTANFVGVDDEAVGILATEHLIQIGCRNIAHIAGPDVSTGHGRLEGFRQALRQHDITIPPSNVVVCKHSDESGENSGHEAMMRLLRHAPYPDGVFCYNDPIALGAMRAILDSGLRIPEDIAIVGCGNIVYADSLRVPLTSVDQQSETIGDRAGKLALACVESKVPLRPKKVLLEPKLVIRQSTQRKNA
ncbi:MAG TPA: LacI family DNA-binding transcriptional regulator [Bryobacteraceae bacterium]|nr:LacI family DNA-binding transcriptional regulator [Bryobacteraceae bacterium]